MTGSADGMCDAAFRCLADPTRRRILEILSEGERSVGDLAGHFDVTRPAISHHLRVLEAGGLVADRHAGQRHYYAIEPAGFAAITGFITALLSSRDQADPRRPDGPSGNSASSTITSHRAPQSSHR